MLPKFTFETKLLDANGSPASILLGFKIILWCRAKGRGGSISSSYIDEGDPLTGDIESSSWFLSYKLVLECLAYYLSLSFTSYSSSWWSVYTG
jgi:hypothetical protein